MAHLLTAGLIPQRTHPLQADLNSDHTSLGLDQLDLGVEEFGHPAKILLQSVRATRLVSFIEEGSSARLCLVKSLHFSAIQRCRS